MFLWENGEASNTVPTSDGIGRLCRLVPEAGATFNRFWGMDLSDGAFRAEPETDVLLRDAIRQSDEFTIEAVLTSTGEPAPGFYDIVSFGLSIGEAGQCNQSRPEPEAFCGKHGFVLGGRFNQVFFGLAGPESNGPRVFDVGFQLGERPRHVLVTFDSGELDIYWTANPGSSLGPSSTCRRATTPRWHSARRHVERPRRGRRVVHAGFQFRRRGSALRRQPGAAGWPVGTCPCSRWTRASSRSGPSRGPRCIRIRWWSTTTASRTVHEGDYGDEKLLVAHRGNLNGRRNRAVGDLVVGRRYVLNLEPFEGHPQLAGLQIVANDEDWHLPLFYAVSDPTAPP